MAVVALLAVIVLGDSMRQWYGYVVLKRPFTSSEVVVMAGGSSPGRLQTTIHHDEGAVAVARRRVLLMGLLTAQHGLEEPPGCWHVSASGREKRRQWEIKLHPLEFQETVEMAEVREEGIVAEQFSFDVVSEVNMQEMKNVVDQATKEIKQRFDFKDSKTEITLKEKEKELSWCPTMSISSTR